MATQQLASGISSNTDVQNPFNWLLQGAICVEFTSAGDLDIDASPDGGSTYVPINDSTITSDTWEIVTPVPLDLRLKPSNGATVNVWLSEGNQVD